MSETTTILQPWPDEVECRHFLKLHDTTTGDPRSTPTLTRASKKQPVQEKLFRAQIDLQKKKTSSNSRSAGTRTNFESPLWPDKRGSPGRAPGQSPVTFGTDRRQPGRIGVRRGLRVSIAKEGEKPETQTSPVCVCRCGRADDFDVFVCMLSFICVCNTSGKDTGDLKFALRAVEQVNKRNRRRTNKSTLILPVMREAHEFNDR